MQRRTILLAGLAATATSLIRPTSARAAPVIGAPAPDFAAPDITGRPIRLGDLRGRTVVLEWTNHDCPFVQKHYRSGNMQATQAEAIAAGAVWIAVISSAPGEQGHVDAATAARLNLDRKATPTHVLLDPDGRIGRAYAAATTPHMFVIRGDGTLAYIGAIDDKPSTRLEDVPGANNYVRAAVRAVQAGQMPPLTSSRAYGCSIKYKTTS